MLGLLAPLIYLLPLFVCFYAFWASAVVELGHFPAPYQDHSAGFDGLRHCFDILFAWSPWAAGASVLMAGMAAAWSADDTPKRDAGRAFLLTVLLSSATFGLAFLWVFTVDPFRAFYWHFD